MAGQVIQGDDDTAMSDINVVPLCDVMLVLLIIFLITIPVVIQNVPVTLPKVPTSRRRPSRTTCR
jgi:biopolymer transport protein ExbD